MTVPTTDTRFHDLILAGRFGEAAKMVRLYCRTATTSGIDTDDLADWLTEGTWPESADRFPTPQEIAEEWDNIS